MAVRRVKVSRATRPGRKSSSPRPKAKVNFSVTQNPYQKAAAKKGTNG